MTRRLAIVTVLLAWLSVAAAAEVTEVAVFGASDLALAFKEIVPKFERVLGVKVTLVLGSTGMLAKQIEHGAPADVFFAADQTFIEGDRAQRGSEADRPAPVERAADPPRRDRQSRSRAVRPRR